MDFNSLAFVDIETTGSSVTADRIIEIGIIKVEDNRIVKKVNSLINPQMHVSPYIEYMTGISSADLVHAPTFEELQADLLEVLSDCIFIAHNVRFDYGFIREEFNRHNVSFSSQCLCTVKLSRSLYPHHSSHNLDSIISRFDFSCEKRHRAFDDAHVLWQFYQHVQKEFPQEKLLTVYKSISKRPSIPSHIDPLVIERLPTGPGIYIFYDKQHIPLYVGKSKNIKDRVLAHFLQVFESEKEMEMCQQVYDIEFRTTTGELGALLLECELAKSLQPYYNRTLKKKEEIVVIMLDTTQVYARPEIKTLQAIYPSELTTILGIFKSKLKAKEFLQRIVKDQGLCSKLVGLEKTKNSCFNHKLGICRGACIGKENSSSYNERLIGAFAHKRIADWYFDGPILIEEQNAGRQTKEGHIFDKWKHIATIQWTQDSTQVVRNSYEYFDLDVYYILKTFLRESPKVTPLSYEKVEELLAAYI